LDRDRLQKEDPVTTTGPEGETRSAVNRFTQTALAWIVASLVRLLLLFLGVPTSELRRLG
jgi:hypothetical protein